MGKTILRPDDDSQIELSMTSGADISIDAAKTDGDSGKLPTFTMIAYSGGPMNANGWPHPVVVDLSGMRIESQAIPARFGHNANGGVGHTTSIKVERGKLIASGTISRDTPEAREIVASSKNGFPWQASIGAGVHEYELVREDETVVVNGQDVTGLAYVVRSSTLSEISFVDLGADRKTSATVAAQKKRDTKMSGKMKARQEEVDMTNPNTNNTKIDAAIDAGTVEHVATKQEDDLVAKIRSSAADESERIAEIRNICANHPGIETNAIRGGWSKDKTELEVLRASRASVPAIHNHNSMDVTPELLECASLQSSGFAGADKLYDDTTVDAAYKRFKGRMGLQEMFIEAAWANGYTGRTFRGNEREILRYAFAKSIEAGFSTSDMSGILSNVSNKFLLEGFTMVENVWSAIAGRRNVSDFKTATSYRMTGTDMYEKVSPGGEIKHGTLGEESFTNKANTYGRLFAITRQDIINDDLGAISAVPRKLGRGSGLKINDVFWTTFRANSGFFKSSNSNFISGATTVLGINGLIQAETAFMKLVDADGQFIGTMPSILLVPPELKAMAERLFKSSEFRDTTASTQMPTSNTHEGKYTPLSSRYLTDSATAWYLLGNPADVATIEVAFLNGQESPTIETADVDFSQLGIQMRGYHDFGVALQDPKGGVKSKGAS